MPFRVVLKKEENENFKVKLLIKWRCKPLIRKYDKKIPAGFGENRAFDTKKLW